MLQDFSFPWQEASFDITPEGKHTVSFPRDFPLQVGYWHFGTQQPISLNYHDYLELLLLVGGTLTCVVGRTRIPLQEGDLFYANCTDFHTVLPVDRQGARGVSIYFLPGLFFPSDDVHYLEFGGRKGMPTNVIGHQKAVMRRVIPLIREIGREWQVRSPHYRLFIKAYLMQVLALLCREGDVHGRRAAYGFKQRAKRKRLEACLDYIQNHFNGALKPGELAKLAAMSRPYFCSYFKETTGTTLTDYINRIRIDAAKQRLREGFGAVSEVAYGVGFENVPYFNRLFQKYVHMSPKQYRDH